ncbi:MAG: response regulator [Calditrichaceae bacterium]|nr:response regulator [Calditrichaceae bacterium]HES59082.1 response regulator [Caldithrix sp.]
MKKILVVDDEPSIRELMHDYLSMQGFEVIEAVDGLDGFNKFMQHNPEAAILDVEMPGMNGQDLTNKILAINRNFPVIIISAFLYKYSRRNFIESGVRAVLEKPVDLRLIKQNLQAIFGTRN